MLFFLNTHKTLYKEKVKSRYFGKQARKEACKTWDRLMSTSWRKNQEDLLLKEGSEVPWHTQEDETP